VRRALLIETDYRGHRIEVTAQHVDGAWDVEVRIRRMFSEDKPHVERVTCRKPTAKVAEERGVIYARRWVDGANLPG
jgi:hypothetical protein